MIPTPLKVEVLPSLESYGNVAGGGRHWLDSCMPERATQTCRCISIMSRPIKCRSSKAAGPDRCFDTQTARCRRRPAKPISSETTQPARLSSGLPLCSCTPIMLCGKPKIYTGSYIFERISCYSECVSVCFCFFFLSFYWPCCLKINDLIWIDLIAELYFFAQAIEVVSFRA